MATTDEKWCPDCGNYHDPAGDHVLDFPLPKVTVMKLAPAADLDAMRAERDAAQALADRRGEVLREVLGRFHMMKSHGALSGWALQVNASEMAVWRARAALDPDGSMNGEDRAR